MFIVRQHISISNSKFVYQNLGLQVLMLDSSWRAISKVMLFSLCQNELERIRTLITMKLHLQTKNDLKIWKIMVFYIQYVISYAIAYWPILFFFFLTARSHLGERVKHILNNHFELEVSRQHNEILEIDKCIAQVQQKLQILRYVATRSFFSTKTLVIS